MKSLQTRSLSLRVVLYFTCNPDEDLASMDIATKYSVDVNAVYQRLTTSVRDGLLARSSTGPGSGRHAIYSAGKVLLDMISVGPKAVPKNEPSDWVLHPISRDDVSPLRLRHDAVISLGGVVWAVRMAQQNRATANMVHEAG